LLGKKDIEEALRRLDNMTQEEARMAAAEVLAIACSTDDKVKDVDERVKSVDMKVESLKDMVEGVDDRLMQVDDKVGIVNDTVKQIACGA